MTSSASLPLTGPPVTVAAWDDAAELRVRRLVERGVDELAELRSVGEIVARIPALVAECVGAGQVVVSRLAAGTLGPVASHETRPATDTVLHERLRPSLVVEYPLAEAEVVRRRRPVDDPTVIANAAYGPDLDDDLVITPMLLGPQVVGLVHAARYDDSLPPEGRRYALEHLLTHALRVAERAEVVRRLRRQQDALRQVATWADTQLGDLHHASFELELGPEEAAGTPPTTGAPAVNRLSAGAYEESLTKREKVVLRCLARGETNAEIARRLVLSEGTVKFHVKNILRKLNAGNRVEAASKYLHMHYREHGT